MEKRKIDDQLNRYERELTEAEAEIDNANQRLAEAQLKLQQAMAKRSALEPRQRLLDDIRTRQVALSNQRRAANQEIEDADKVHSKLFAQLEKLLSKENRDSVDAAIAAVDQELANLLDKMENSAREVAKAEQEAHRCKEEVAALEASYQGAQAELQRLPAQITVAQSQVAGAKTAAKGAVESGQTSEAFFLTRDLARAIGNLKQAADPAKEAALLDRLLELWPNLEDAKLVTQDKATDLEERKREWTEAEQQLKPKVEARDTAVKAKLAESSKPTEQPEAGPAGLPCR